MADMRCLLVVFLDWCEVSHKSLIFKWCDVISYYEMHDRRMSRGDSLRIASPRGSIIAPMPAAVRRRQAPRRPIRHLGRARLFGRWWRRQSPARQDRFATLGPLISVLLFLAAIISAFWYLRNEEFEREQESVKRDTEIAQQQIRLRLIENQEQLVRIAREIVTALDRPRQLPRPGRELHARAPEITNLIWVNAGTRAEGGLLGDELPPETGMQRRRDDRRSLPTRRQRQRAREALSARRASRASRSTRGRSPDTLSATPVFQVAGPADRPQRLLRHADRRVLGRARCCATSCRPRCRAATRSALLDAQDRSLASTVIADAGHRPPGRPSIVLRRAGRAGRATA